MTTGKTGLARLFEIAGEKRGLLIVSGILSSLSAVFMLVPYVSVYWILRELLAHAANPAMASGDFMIRWGVIALIGLLCSLATMYAGGMALSLFAALPIAVLLVLMSGVQRKLGAAHMRSKIDAANRLQEYLNGIRVIKAHNLAGERFVWLERSFQQLKRHSIRIEGLLGPIVLSAIACLRAGLTLMVIVGVHLLLGGSLELVVFVSFLIVGTRIFDPLTTALVNYAEFRYHEQAGVRIVKLLQEPIMDGDREPPEGHDVEFGQVTFGYNETAVLKDVSIRMPAGSFTALVGP